MRSPTPSSGTSSSRRASPGASWSDIGRSLGTSKQAARQPFVARSQTAAALLDSSQGFSRFADDARAVVLTAQQRARQAGNDGLGVGQLVLGLIGAPPPQQHVLSRLRQCRCRRLNGPLWPRWPAATAAVPDLIPFDAHARTAPEGSFAAAQRRGADTIGSEHILLSLLATEAGTGVLAGLGVTSEAVEAFLEPEPA